MKSIYNTQVIIPLIAIFYNNNGFTLDGLVLKIVTNYYGLISEKWNKRKEISA